MALKLLKRDELLVEVSMSKVLTESDNKVTYSFSVDAFEAGTPFFLEVEACGEGGNNVSGLVFVKKL